MTGNRFASILSTFNALISHKCLRLRRHARLNVIARMIWNRISLVRRKAALFINPCNTPLDGLSVSVTEKLAISPFLHSRKYGMPNERNCPLFFTFSQSLPSLSICSLHAFSSSSGVTSRSSFAILQIGVNSIPMLLPSPFLMWSTTS